MIELRFFGVIQLNNKWVHTGMVTIYGSYQISRVLVSKGHLNVNKKVNAYQLFDDEQGKEVRMKKPSPPISPIAFL